MNQTTAWIGRRVSSLLPGKAKADTAPAPHPPAGASPPPTPGGGAPRAPGPRRWPVEHEAHLELLAGLRLQLDFLEAGAHLRHRGLRGDCGERQVANAQVALVHGNGGILSTHCTLLLGAA